MAAIAVAARPWRLPMAALFAGTALGAVPAEQPGLALPLSPVVFAGSTGVEVWRFSGSCSVAPGRGR